MNTCPQVASQKAFLMRGSIICAGLKVHCCKLNPLPYLQWLGEVALPCVESWQPSEARILAWICIRQTWQTTPQATIRFRILQPAIALSRCVNWAAHVRHSAVCQTTYCVTAFLSPQPTIHPKVPTHLQSLLACTWSRASAANSLPQLALEILL
jgi:hypothetical protein